MLKILKSFFIRFYLFFRSDKLHLFFFELGISLLDSHIKFIPHLLKLSIFFFDKKIQLFFISFKLLYLFFHDGRQSSLLMYIFVWILIFLQSYLQLFLLGFKLLALLLKGMLQLNMLLLKFQIFLFPILIRIFFVLEFRSKNTIYFAWGSLCKWLPVFHQILSFEIIK